MEGYTKIGRIRPNYTGAWNAETAYTVLEMVKNEAGTASYIAKQDVPAGTLLTDEAYWAMVLDAGDVIDAAEKAAERANKAADALGIVPIATGGVIAVSDASDMPLKGLKLFGKTTQDGTPTPETPVDLVNVGDAGSVGVSVCGKNLISNTGITTTIRGITFTVNDDGSITANGTSTEKAYFKVGAVYTSSNEQYVITGCPSGGGFTTYRVYDEIIKSYDAGTGSNLYNGIDDISQIYIYVDSGITLNNLVFKPMVRLASVSDNNYEAPTVQTLTALTPNGLAGIPVSSGGNYTDANGQHWVCDEIDFERNMYVKRIGIVENYSGETITTAYISSTGALTAGAYIQYILAESIETALTAEEIAAYRALHSNYPNTTIYNDGGADMEVKYVADTKLYIDNKFAAMQEAIINA